MQLLPLLPLLLPLLLPCCAGDPDPDLRCTLGKTGFHRELRCAWRLPSACAVPVQLRLNVSASFAVDRFELRSRGLAFATDRYVSHEAPAWLASAFQLTLTTTRSDVALPIHLRYHLPSQLRYVAAFLPHPRLAYTCGGRPHVTARRRPFDVECPVAPIDHMPAAVTLTVLTLCSALMIQFFSFFG